MHTVVDDFQATSNNGVMSVEFDQCMLGLVSKVWKTPMRKRTKILTNSKVLVQLLQGCRCDRLHEHVAIRGCEGGQTRSSWAQKYPERLVGVIAESARQSC